ncbi:hypothetical protein S40285_10573 [Stachybotrys chlorohalonatus IBT 40285]|uniref:Uncharacterized protein n=1 Tax=Stachybotrys chlorohalonatus (strain IBT 40285) TaxID=1283841 RepID=A0A084QJY5_STAC4|nr:hypothetical protein S40285_10573 [Stachybotrys chlorohalonata IBT 40285]
MSKGEARTGEPPPSSFDLCSSGTAKTSGPRQGTDLPTARPTAATKERDPGLRTPGGEIDRATDDVLGILQSN